MEMPTKSRYLILLLVVFLLLAVVAVSAVYAGGFSFLIDGIDLVGKACTSGCTAIL
jgi:hypothetical protein